MRFYKIGDKLLTRNGKMLVRGERVFCMKIVTPVSPYDVGFYVTNPVSLLVDWGDGSQDTLNSSGTKLHTYTTAGTYFIRWLSGTTERLYFGTTNTPDTTINNSCYREVVSPVDAGLGINDASTMFAGCWYLSNWAPGFFDDASPNVTSLYGMFAGVGALTTQFNEDLSNWNTSKVKSIQQTFIYCYPFTGTGLQNWDMSNCESFLAAFEYCLFAFTGSTIAGWNTAKNVDLARAFLAADQFTADISGFNCEKVWRANDMVTSAWSTASYDAFLNSLAGQSVLDDVVLGVLGTKYSDDGQAARTHLIDTHGWTISDLGHI